jgi:WS/DGAT/MGAT family acyltransferase
VAPDATARPQRDKPLHGIDAAFLASESRTTHWHIVGALVLDPSTAPRKLDTKGVREVVAERLPRVDALRRRVIDLPFPFSIPHWTISRPVEVDLDHHVRRADLPPGASMHALAQLTAELAEGSLPRNKPLWEMVVVEDMADGNVAIVAKVHHSLVDGIAAMGIIGALFDLEPTPPVATIPEAFQAPRQRGLSVGRVFSRIASQPSRVVRATGRAAGTVVGYARAVSKHSATLPLTAPRMGMSRSISTRRAVSFVSVPLLELKAVRKAFGATLNDVVMAVCAGALRRWLQSAGDLPDRALVAAVPVSVAGRVAGAAASAGNQVSVLFATLPTELDDPLARLEAVKGGMSGAKKAHAALGPSTLGHIADAAPWNLLGLLFRAYSDLGLANRLPPAVNLILSNVPGPPVPLYIGGAKLVALFPLGPIFDGAALNVTVASCEGEVGFGFLGCPDVLPPLDDLAAEVPRALAELSALVPAGAS